NSNLPDEISVRAGKRPGATEPEIEVAKAKIAIVPGRRKDKTKIEYPSCRVEFHLIEWFQPDPVTRDRLERLSIRSRDDDVPDLRDGPSDPMQLHLDRGRRHVRHLGSARKQRLIL